MDTQIDHFMYAVSDLDDGIAWATDTFDAAPVYGGEHIGLGTRNALLSLGDTYLEIIAPDPAQTLAGTFGERLARLDEGGLVTWAARGDLARIRDTLKSREIGCRGPVRTERETRDGTRLTWELLFPNGHAFGARFPFFIDWLDCAHPAETAPVGGRLRSLTLTLPKTNAIEEALSAIALDAAELEIVTGEPAIALAIDCATGIVRLASNAATVELNMGG